MVIEPKKIMKRKLAYFEDRGSELQSYSLLLAVYYDDFEKAKASLVSDPDQLNTPDPYAGLTALHIAIFRQNARIIRLLLDQPSIKVTVKDVFGRRSVDMLDYSVNQEIFEMVIGATYPSEAHALLDETQGGASGNMNVVKLKPKGLNYDT